MSALRTNSRSSTARLCRFGRDDARLELGRWQWFYGEGESVDGCDAHLRVARSRCGAVELGAWSDPIVVAASVKVAGLQFRNCPVDTISSYGSMGGSDMGMGQKLDDNDTSAYLEAEDVLTDTQKPGAREIASRYRQQRFERRQQRLSGRSPPPPETPSPAPESSSGPML